MAFLVNRRPAASWLSGLERCGMDGGEVKEAFVFGMHLRRLRHP